MIDEQRTFWLTAFGAFTADGIDWQATTEGIPKVLAFASKILPQATGVEGEIVNVQEVADSFSESLQVEGFHLQLLLIRGYVQPPACVLAGQGIWIDDLTPAPSS